MKVSKSNFYNRLLHLLPWLIIGLGVILRLAVFLQNRNLIIDESNIARNLYERDFIDLLLPLNYEQYAPPVFLWVLKSASILFGFSEYSLRLYSLFCGIMSLFAMYLLLKEFVPGRSIWYALFLFATAHMMLRYSAEVKQYMSDVLVVVTLLLLALRTNIYTVKTSRFILFWILTGSLAIWLSMPSVFALAGVGVYYFFFCLEIKNYKKISVLAACIIVWVLQFLFYYYAILSDQANSDYLQGVMTKFFLSPDFFDFQKQVENWAVFSALLRPFGNNQPFQLNIIFNMALLLIGAFFLIKHNLAKASLLLMPVVLLLTAAFLRQFTLLPRVSLFIIPVLLVVITYGLEQLYRIKFTPWHVILTGLTIIYAFNGNAVSMLWKPFKSEEITEGLSFFKENNIQGSDIFLYHSSEPAYIYYTQIHPGKKELGFAKGAKSLEWNTEYNSLADSMKNILGVNKPFGFLLTNSTEEEARERFNSMDKVFKNKSYIHKDYIKAYIFTNENEPAQ